jgi:hypothetical protein
MEGAHRIAWERAHGPIPAGMIVCHKCDTRSCVNPAHLFLGTPTDNMRDKQRKGRGNQCRGERQGHAKLTLAQARQIKHTTIPAAEFVRRFGVSHGCVREIRIGRNWKHA